MQVHTKVEVTNQDEFQKSLSQLLLMLILRVIVSLKQWSLTRKIHLTFKQKQGINAHRSIGLFLCGSLNLTVAEGPSRLCGCSSYAVSQRFHFSILLNIRLRTWRTCACVIWTQYSSFHLACQTWSDTTSDINCVIPFQNAHNYLIIPNCLILEWPGNPSCPPSLRMFQNPYFCSEDGGDLLEDTWARQHETIPLGSHLSYRHTLSLEICFCLDRSATAEQWTALTSS